MDPQSLSSLLYFYGIFLICCGVAAVVFIGAKAKTAVMSGGTSGILSCAIAYLVSDNSTWAPVAGICLALALFVVFSWRSSKTLFRIFELISSHKTDGELKGKGIAFLIISLMAVVSMFVFALQIVKFRAGV